MRGNTTPDNYNNLPYIVIQCHYKSFDLCFSNERLKKVVLAFFPSEVVIS